MNAAIVAFLLAASAAAGAPATPPAGASQKATERSKTGEPMALMEVRDVISTPGTGSFVVLLKEKHGRRIVPIAIGPAEGLAIQMRLNRQKAPRPLTHDLLDRVMAALGAKLVKVHVEALRDQVFLGRLFLMQGKRSLDIDSRPSDAMALAVGSGVPVYCARNVIAEVGIELDQIMPPDDKPAEPAPLSPWRELLKPQPQDDDTL